MFGRLAQGYLNRGASADLPLPRHRKRFELKLDFSSHLWVKAVHIFTSASHREDVLVA